MKKLFNIFMLSLIFSLNFTNLWSAPFEGKVVYRTYTKTGFFSVDISMTFYLKGPKVRVDPEKNASYTIADFSAHTMMTVRPVDQTYTKIPWTLDKEPVPQGWTFSKTEKTQIVLGRMCQQWIYKENGTTSIVWAAGGIGDFNGIGKSKTWAGVLKKKKLFPLKIETNYEKTDFLKNNSTMEATQLEAGPLDDSIFSVPQGYQEKK